ncbi:MAG: outer membrane beta-barrel protein [bacterium]
MKKTFVLMAIMGLVLIGKGFAQNISAGGGLGYLIPSKDVKDNYGDSAIALGGFVNYPINAQISLLGEIDYYKVSGKEFTRKSGTDSAVPAGSLTSGVCKDSLRVIPITISCLYGFPIQENLFGYVGGGLGVFVAKKEIENPSSKGTATFTTKKDSESKSPIGFQVRGGVSYAVSPSVSLHGELRYIYAKAWEQNLGGIGIGLGATYRFLGATEEK